MSYHIVSTDTPECRLSCRDGQLTCRNGTGPERPLPGVTREFERSCVEAVVRSFRKALMTGQRGLYKRGHLHRP